MSTIEALAATNLEDAIFEQMQRDVAADVTADIIDAAAVRSFADLHNFADANDYGIRCTPWDEDDADDAIYSRFTALSTDEQIATLNAAQTRVDAWIRSGALTAAN